MPVLLLVLYRGFQYTRLPPRTWRKLALESSGNLVASQKKPRCAKRSEAFFDLLPDFLRFCFLELCTATIQTYSKVLKSSRCRALPVQKVPKTMPTELSGQMYRVFRYEALFWHTVPLMEFMLEKSLRVLNKSVQLDLQLTSVPPSDQKVTARCTLLFQIRTCFFELWALYCSIGLCTV